MEACYCIEGEGEVEADGILYPIQPGTMYALDKHDKHYLRAKTTMRLYAYLLPLCKEMNHTTFKAAEVPVTKLQSTLIV
jgi:L-ectoine synthase